MTATAEPEIGKARVRKEDEHLITGRTRWTDNIVLPGLQHIAILRSPVAHARITAIDTNAARSMPGVGSDSCSRSAGTWVSGSWEVGTPTTLERGL